MNNYLKISLSFLISFAFFLSPANQAAARSFVLSVPFTPQAPLGEWSDQRQGDGCEEASAAMAMAWVKGQYFTKNEWRNKIIGLSDWEKKKHGEHRDVSIQDVVDWVFKDYYDYDKVELKSVLNVGDIIRELEDGRVVLAPMNGRSLRNPYFTPPGPLTHMLLIKGYDYSTKEFIVNDPGTRRGNSYRYSSSILFKAIKVYPTGHYEPIKKTVKQMIVVSKP